MPIKLIAPKSGNTLREDAGGLHDDRGNQFPKSNGVFRMVSGSNYTDNFGLQWNKFAKTQLDSESNALQSRRRFLAETGWENDRLGGTTVLEVGSGAGRFTQVILEQTEAELYSVDYSSAVEANFRNNGHHGARLKLFQASIYELPFADDSFDKVICLGVLQHTPDFEASVGALIRKAKPGGEIVVDFYPIKGWWTGIQAKYILRPLTKGMPHAHLLALIEGNIDWLIAAYFLLRRLRLRVLARFLPLVDLRSMDSLGLTPAQLREWAILDTFDMFSPEHDHPQKISTVARWFERHGATVTFAGFKAYEGGLGAAVVRGVKKG